MKSQSKALVSPDLALCTPNKFRCKVKNFQRHSAFSPCFFVCIVSLNACICERWKCACIGLCAYVWESLLWVQIRIQRSALSALSVTDRSHLPHSFCCCQQADCQYEAEIQQHLLLHHFFLYTLSCFFFSFPRTVCICRHFSAMQFWDSWVRKNSQNPNKS